MEDVRELLEMGLTEEQIAIELDLEIHIVRQISDTINKHGEVSDELESLLHRKFSKYNIKLEWFVDPYDNLMDETIKFINTLEDYTVEFMYNEDEFFNEYPAYHTIGKDNIEICNFI